MCFLCLGVPLTVHILLPYSKVESAASRTLVSLRSKAVTDSVLVCVTSKVSVFLRSLRIHRPFAG